MHGNSFSEYLIQLSNALVNQGHQVLLVASKSLIEITVGNDHQKLIDDRVETYFYDLNGKKSRRSFMFYKNILGRISKFSPEVIHLHESGELEALFILVRFIRKPIVLTIHDVARHSGADSQIIFRRKFIRYFSRRIADAIHVHGNALKNQFIDDYPLRTDQTFVIPHGTLTIFKYWDDGNTCKEPNTCLFFGRMQKYQGVDNLILIGKKLKAMNPLIKIIIAGSGPELDRYKSTLTEVGIFEIHDFFIPDHDVHQFFQRSSLLLIPYHEASQSGVIHMGLAFGVPIIATAVGAIKETVHDGVHGKIVNTGDLELFAQSVNQLLHDRKALEQMSTACSEQGIRLDFSNLMSSYEHLYSYAINHKALQQIPAAI
jgi:glycosyltransferase involved in cell wall biosynthesis